MTIATRIFMMNEVFIQVMDKLNGELQLQIES
jgi:hypothetical protein